MISRPYLLVNPRKRHKNATKNDKDTGKVLKHVSLLHGNTISMVLIYGFFAEFSHENVYL